MSERVTILICAVLLLGLWVVRLAYHVDRLAQELAELRGELVEHELVRALRRDRGMRW